MKKLLSLLLTVSLCLSGAVISAGAVPSPTVGLYGDMNDDGSVTIDDATLLQRGLAELVTLNEKQWVLADYNHDDAVNVKDVTAIQRIVAELPQSEGYGGYLLNPYLDDFYPDYLSGSMPVGTPVTFTACSELGEEYAFWVEDAMVQPRSADNTCTVTFTEPGSYQVSVCAYGDRMFGSRTINYCVAENGLDAELRINRLRLDKDTGYPDAYTVWLGAAGGTGPYTYSMKLEVDSNDRWVWESFGLTIDDPDRFSAYCANHETDWQTAYDADNNEYYVRDFAADDVLTIDCEMLNFWDIAHVLTIQAKDANGVLSAPLRIDIQAINAAG